MGNLAIDIGNTKIKVGFFKDADLIFNRLYDQDTIMAGIRGILSEVEVSDIMICNSGNLENVVTLLSEKGLSFKILDHRTPVPFTNRYKTPETLGLDRVALVSAAVMYRPGKKVLVIDAGTCVTYDFKNENEEYLGGAIAPGLYMRFNALHNFTNRLPLLTPVAGPEYLGKNTAEAIQSGVVNGIIAEIKTAIHWYEENYGDVEIILTGGDMQFLSKTLKNGIFANSNFLLEGLNYLMVFNKTQ